MLCIFSVNIGHSTVTESSLPYVYTNSFKSMYPTFGKNTCHMTKAITSVVLKHKFFAKHLDFFESNL